MRRYDSVYRNFSNLMETHRRHELWAQFVGDQTPREFLQLGMGCNKGKSGAERLTIPRLVDEYIAAAPAMFGAGVVVPSDLHRALRESLEIAADCADGSHGQFASESDIAKGRAMCPECSCRKFSRAMVGKDRYDPLLEFTCTNCGHVTDDQGFDLIYVYIQDW